MRQCDVVFYPPYPLSPDPLYQDKGSTCVTIGMNKISNDSFVRERVDEVTFNSVRESPCLWKLLRRALSLSNFSIEDED